MILWLTFYHSPQSGVSAVQIQNATKKANVSEAEQSQLVGMAAVLVSCISSGFAGVYFEKILKGGEDKSDVKQAYS